MLQVLQRIAGKDLEGLVTIQLTMLQVNGLGDVQVGAELTKKRGLPDTIGRHTFEYDSTYHHAVWLPQGHLGKESRLGISRAEKMVFVSSAAKVANRDLKSSEEAELELLCSAVDEESFGTAMVDCVLISESS
ncbi:TPA: hypothetical protein ACH3X1_014231 [Trebouxia sp. C0004]